MLYRRGSNYRDGHIADADVLMGELFDSVDALNNIDQNNFQDNGIGTARVLASSAWAPGVGSPTLTVAHTGSHLLADTLGGLFPGNNLGGWVTSAEQVGGEAALPFTTVGRLRMRFYAFGQYENLVSGLSILDMRLLVDGAPRRIFTASLPRGVAGNTYFGWNLSDEMLLAPGAHTVQLQVRDRSADAGVIREQAGGTSGYGKVFVIGFRP